MADFKAALTIGLSAALEAERRREEVAKVLAELDTQVYDATNGKITITIEVWTGNAVEQIDALIQRKILPNKALVASTTGQNIRKRTLSIWEQSTDGYPCTLTIDKTIYSCEDKEALEGCLSRLLQDPNVGEKIHALMQADAV